MSKSTGNSRFRAVNIEDFDENAYFDNIEDIGSTGPDRTRVMELLNGGKKQEALQAVLQNPPYGSKNETLRKMCSSLVTKVLSSFKSIETEKAVRSLDQEMLDTLMQYIYKGFEAPSTQSCSVLLTWHEKVHAVGGNGCITRALTTRKPL
ncbi:actin-related protein 2/3 complex subunit 5-C-like [Anneissia japonica]|uniref:actin-related protein 2/3 complex subunit 5-C-like n=1 Tax=Anneissia japonica TaxID=1529436 RepID=UPI00142590E7|nr:actin-related protein 2/3 complex subunit 5-C-like [Anneissia japonica]